MSVKLTMNKDDHAEAGKEGWAIVDEDDLPTIQKIDSPDEGEIADPLETDDDAHLIVVRGLFAGKTHCVRAMEFIRARNPEHYVDVLMSAANMALYT